MCVQVCGCMCHVFRVLSDKYVLDDSGTGAVHQMRLTYVCVQVCGCMCHVFCVLSVKFALDDSGTGVVHQLMLTNGQDDWPMIRVKDSKVISRLL